MQRSFSDLACAAKRKVTRHDRSKFDRPQTCVQLPVTDGQIAYEWQHLLHKLCGRNPALHEHWRSWQAPECRPLFVVRRGQVEPWERPGPAGAL